MGIDRNCRFPYEAIIGVKLRIPPHEAHLLSVPEILAPPFPEILGPGVPLHGFHFFLDTEEGKGVGYALDIEP